MTALAGSRGPSREPSFTREFHTAMVRQELDAAPDASIAALTDQTAVASRHSLHEQLATDDANVGAVESPRIERKPQRSNDRKLHSTATGARAA